MDSNKDEALRCINKAKEALASGNKPRALKFIRIAQRLNKNLSVDDLLAACGNIDEQTAESTSCSNNNVSSSVRSDEVANGEARSYREEHAQLVRKVKKSTDYYEILGLMRSCSVEEIKKAYRKISLKVHPDKNKAPGSEEAFKKVSKAFKCLSDEKARRQYDHTGLVDEFEYNQHYNVPRRRRRSSGRDMFNDEFDPDEIFRSFFGQTDMYRNPYIYRNRTTTHQQREVNGDTGPNIMLLLQMLPIFFIILLAYSYLLISEPEYSLHRNYNYEFAKMTEEYRVQYYVKTAQFDQIFPVGSSDRINIENNVIKDYKSMLGRYCHIELRRRQWSRNMPTPNCDKLHNFGVA